MGERRDAAAAGDGEGREAATASDGEGREAATASDGEGREATMAGDEGRAPPVVVQERTGRRRRARAERGHGGVRCRGVAGRRADGGGGRCRGGAGRRGVRLRCTMTMIPLDE